MRKSLFGLVFCLLWAASAAAETPRDVAADLLAGRLEAAAAAEAWDRAGLDAVGARGLLADGPLAAGPAEDHAVTLTDPLGRESEVLVRLPEEAGPDGRYGVLLVLHGLRSSPDALLPFARRVAPPGTILVAPAAQRLPLEHENEDMVDLGLDRELDEDASESQRRLQERLRELARRAQERMLPHWWSYGARSFPLLALDYLVARYPVDTDRVAILGYSMGGYGAWNVGLRYADRFAAAVPLAGGISRKENLAPRDAASRHLLANARMVPTFFAHGSDDPIVPVRFSRTIAADLEQLGADFVYEEVAGGQHVLRPFLEGNALTDQLRGWLAGKARDPHPRQVVHAALGAYHGGSYWVRVDALRDARGRVEAEVLEGNRIVVRTEGVARVTVFLDPALLDLERPVRIDLDGVPTWEGVAEPDLRTVAETYAASRDPALVYARRVTLDVPTSRSF